MVEPVIAPPTRRQALIARGEQLILVVLALVVVAGVAYRAATYLRLGWEPLEAVPAAPPTYQVDVNSADWVTLALVPGLGEALSKRIVDERKAQGGRFQSLEDLKQVRGISDKMLENLRPYLCVGSPGPEPVRMSDAP